MILVVGLTTKVAVLVHSLRGPPLLSMHSMPMPDGHHFVQSTQGQEVLLLLLGQGIADQMRESEVRLRRVASPASVGLG